MIVAGSSLKVVVATRRWILPVEGAFPVPAKGPEPDILAGLVEVPVPVVAPAPLGGADMDPARCLVRNRSKRPWSLAARGCAWRLK